MPTFQANYNLFATDGETFFAFPHGLPIPGDFFHRGSRPWTGLIKFQGYPFRTFRDPRTGIEHQTGNADTAVFREQDVVINQIGGQGTTPIVLAALQLRSVGPIAVGVGNRVQHWDVEVRVSRSRPSAGQMTIHHTSATGGHFDSELNVVPEFTFIRQADGDQKVLDFGTVSVPAPRQALAARAITLQDFDVPFELTHPADALHIAGLTSTNFAVARAVTGTHAVVRAVAAF
jgi:hypothetical protein